MLKKWLLRLLLPEWDGLRLEKDLVEVERDRLKSQLSHAKTEWLIFARAFSQGGDFAVCRSDTSEPLGFAGEMVLGSLFGSLNKTLEVKDNPMPNVVNVAELLYRERHK